MHEPPPPRAARATDLLAELNATVTEALDRRREAADDPTTITHDAATSAGPVTSLSRGPRTGWGRWPSPVADIGPGFRRNRTYAAIATEAHPQHGRHRGDGGLPSGKSSKRSARRTRPKIQNSESAATPPRRPGGIRGW